MKPSTHLDSAVFQLTPTRTRCDLVISANGKTEKVASGLLNPFITHLKTAQDQVAKGGYSIILQPEAGTDTLWFTKATMERFVRFVSTPEILERVYNLESEILQIEEAISIQGNNEMALTVEENQAKHSESVEGCRPLPDRNNEKAIVLYEPGVQSHEANGSTTPEGNSKVQLLKVLETRKSMLQKEQGMAFARAVAAGFNIDNMSPLLTFSDCFGASRLKDACARFKELWKKKHEMGQWLEIEAAEAMLSRSEFCAMNASGIMLSSVANKHNELKETLPELPLETNGRSTCTTGIDEKPAIYNQPTNGHQEYFQGQYPHHMYPPWPIHSSPGALPVYQGFPMQGMPYYPNYPGAGPYYQPPYPMAEDPRLNPGQRIKKRHSMDSCNSKLESEAWDMDASRTRSLDDADLEEEDSQIQESRKRTSRLSKKQSGMVVVQNVNYITSKKHNSSDTESQCASDSQTEEEYKSGSLEQKHKKSQRSSKSQGGRTEKYYAQNKEADGGHWDAFQNLLLRNANDDKHIVDHDMIAMEKKAQTRRRQNTVGNDPIAFGDQGALEVQNGGVVNMHKISGTVTRMPKNSNDKYFISEREGQFSTEGGQMNLHSTEVDARRVGYRRSTNDDFMNGPENRLAFTSSSDALDVNGFDRTANGTNRRSSHNIDNDSYIVSLRSSELDKIPNDNRNAINMDSEVPNATQRPENIFTRAGRRVNYEPDGLSVMPHRGSENGASGYDPAFDYEMQVQTEVGVLSNKKNKKVVTDDKKGVKKLEDRKLNNIRDVSDKKKLVGGPIRRGKPSKLSPLDEARARAEKVKTFKADLQKMKKEKQEEEMKRIEALKIARQKRIAARNCNVPTRSALSSQQTRKQIVAKTSPSSLKGSKFSDTEPGPSSPLQIYRIRTSLGSSSTEKISKPSRLNSGSHSTRNKLSRSASSLPEPRKENSGVVSTDTKASMARIRRLSEPKMSSSHHVSSVKSRSNEITSKPKVSVGSESKKVPAIVNHDTSKTATRPELKIRTGKGPDVTSKSTKEMTRKGNQNKPSATPRGAESTKKNENISHYSDGDDNVVIDKTIVMLECEKSSVPAITVSEDNANIKEDYRKVKTGEKQKVESHFAAIHSSASSHTMGAVGREPTGNPSHKQIDTQKVSVGGSGKDSVKFSNIAISEKPYQAPHARVSSFEYGKAQPTNLDSTATSSVPVRAHFSDYRDLKLEKIPEVLEKPQIKESPKGLKRLLMFGRKSQSSAAGECNSADSDNISCGGSVTNCTVHSEVHTLKNLISQDETTGATTTPQKSSRHFSLLSPFRSKTSEKPRA